MAERLWYHGAETSVGLHVERPIPPKRPEMVKRTKDGSTEYLGARDERFAFMPRWWRAQLFMTLLWDRHDGHCGICGQRIFHVFDLHVDHVVPKALGGEDRWENVRPVHIRCNLLRGQELRCKLIRITPEDRERLSFVYEKERRCMVGVFGIAV